MHLRELASVDSVRELASVDFVRELASVDSVTKQTELEWLSTDNLSSPLFA